MFCRLLMKMLVTDGLAFSSKLSFGTVYFPNIHNITKYLKIILKHYECMRVGFSTMCSTHPDPQELSGCIGIARRQYLDLR